MSPSLLPAADREIGLLIDCARPAIEPERAAAIRERAAGVNWDRFLALAHRHGLAPLVFFHLNRIGVADVPADRWARLRDYYHKNGAFNLLLTGELVRLLTLLNDRGIRALAYKGPAIAVKLYGHVALRQFCDLDILVAERDAWDACRVIEDRGFEPHFRVAEDQRDAFVRHTYAQEFHRDGGRTKVELHWRISEPAFSVRFDAAALWPRRGEVALPGGTVAMSSLEDLLLMTCIHGGRHGWHKLEAVCSVAEVLRRQADLDWDEVWRLAGEMRCRRMLVLGLLLAQGLYDAPLPAQAEAMSRSRTLRAMAVRIVRDAAAAEEPPLTFTRRAARHLRLEDEWTGQVRHGARLILAPSPDHVTEMGAGSFAFAYPPLVRAARLARRLATGFSR